MQLSQKENTFSQFLSEFFKSGFNSKHFGRKVTLIAFLFRNLRTPKKKIDKCLKSLVSEIPCTSNMADVPKHSLNLIHSIFMWFINPCQLNRVKKSLLLTWKILGLLVNALAAKCKYPVFNRYNLKIPIQMQLSQIQKNFSDFFVGYLKSRLSFKCFGEEYGRHRLPILWTLKT